MSDPVLQLLCAALVLLVPVGVQLGLPRGSTPRILALSAVVALAALASLLTDVGAGDGLDLPASLLDASFAGALAGSVGLIAAQSLGTTGGAVFGLSWSIVVFQPVAAAVLDGVPSFMQRAFGAIDYSGVLASHVAAGSALLALSLLPLGRHRRVENSRVGDASGDPSSRVVLSWSRGTLGASLVTVGGAAWMVGVERALTEASGRTLANALAGMALGALVWVVVEKIAVDRVSAGGLIAGALVGWSAIGAGVPYLSPVALGAATIGATAAAVGAVARSRARGSSALRWGGGAVLVAAVVGGIVMTLLADRFGLAEMATITFTVGQLSATVVVAVVAALGGILCGLLAWGVSRWAIPDSN